MVKKVLAAVLAGTIAISLVACGDNTSDDAQVESDSGQQEEVTETEEEDADSEEKEEEAEDLIEENDEQKPEVSETESFYNLTMTLTKEDCRKDNLGFYEYNGITFLGDDSDWMDSPLNTEGTINAGSFYRKLQSCLANFSMGNSWQSYAEHIIGYTPESREEFEPYVDEYLTYMTDSQFGNSMMSKFQTMDSVYVSQNGEDYTCTIYDVSDCADELNISEEMLGYILGGLHDCAATITFNGNTCVIEYHDYSDEIETTDTETYDNRDFSSVIEQMATLPTEGHIDLSDLVEVEEDGQTFLGYNVRYTSDNVNASTFQILCNPDVDGLMSMVLLPDTLNSNSGSVDFSYVMIYLIMAVDDTISFDDAANLATEVLDLNGEDLTKNGITYSFSPNSMFLAISY